MDRRDGSMREGGVGGRGVQVGRAFRSFKELAWCFTEHSRGQVRGDGRECQNREGASSSYQGATFNEGGVVGRGGCITSLI
jgi:hypothetical protein